MLLCRREFLKISTGTLFLTPIITQFLLANDPPPFPLQGDSHKELGTKLQNLSGTIFVPFVIRGEKNSCKVALTYDDGPTPGVTDVILDQLAAHNSHATFFVIGRRVQLFPDLARRIVREGHEIANHSFTHPNLSKLPSSKVFKEIEMTQKTIEDICGVTPKYFRPPYGAFRVSQGEITRNLDLQVILWSLDPEDWRLPGITTIANRIVTNTSAGEIILCHDLHTQTALASQLFIPRISENYTLVSLSGLLRSSRTKL